MKKFLVALALLPYYLFSQEIYNTSCDGAWFLSSATPQETFEYDMTGVGSQTNTELFFYFRSNTTGTGLKIADASAKLNTTNLGVTYEIYGGYDSQEEICSGLANLTAPLISSGSGSGNFGITTNLQTDKFYVIRLVVAGRKGKVIFDLVHTLLSNLWKEVQCQDCISGFKPPFGTYIISAWVKDASAGATAINYDKPYIVFSDGVVAAVNCPATGDIIEGWQRIEKEVVVSLASNNVSIDLKCGSGGDCYFDDVRMFPKDGSMITYVYDPTTFRLIAELDERNYAKIYEYDEEGKLIRIKKETERGIMTIQETRENNAGN